MSSSLAPKWVPALLVTVAATLGFAGSALAALPDIKQGPAPTWDGGFSMVKVGSQVQLQFPAEIDITTNGGPLTITGSRKDTTREHDGRVRGGRERRGGRAPVQLRPEPSALALPRALDRYDLRSHDSSLTEVARDQKTGFCLVQSAQINPTDCQHNNPSALSVSETINPGFSDIYDPARDGQYIDVTGLNGTYEFIQWVNADCRLADMGPAGHTWATVLQHQRHRRDADGHGHEPDAALEQLLRGPQQRAEVPADRDGAAGRERERPGGQHRSRRCRAPGSTGWRTSSPTSGAAATRPAGTAPTSPARRHRTTRRPTPTPVTPSARGSRATSSAAASRAPRRTPRPPPSCPAARARPPTTTTGSSTARATTTSDRTTATTTSPAARRARHEPGGAVAHGGAEVAAPRQRPQPGRRDGVRARAHCSEACRVRAQPDRPRRREARPHDQHALEGGSRTLTLKLTRKAQKIVSRFHSGTLTLWLYVKGSDGQQQTVSHLLHIKG